METKLIFAWVSIQKMVSEWSSQIAKAIWCQKERWRHLLYVTTLPASRARTKYLIPTDNIIVLDWYFNLTEEI